MASDRQALPDRSARPGSLKVEITNGPETVVYGSRLTTEQAVEEVCLYLPVVPASERDRLRAQVTHLKEEQVSLVGSLGDAQAEVERLREQYTALQRTWHKSIDALHLAVAERQMLREAAIGTSSAGGFYCKLCDSPAWNRRESIRAPIPGPGLDIVDRYKSSGHHTVGFLKAEEAQQGARRLAAHLGVEGETFDVVEVESAGAHILLHEVSLHA